MHSRPGLSRFDVVVILVVAIVAAGLAVHFLVRQNYQAQRAHCAYNLKRLGEGIWNYDLNGDYLPPSRIADDYATWVVLIANSVPKIRPNDPENPLINWDASKPYAEQPPELREAWFAAMRCPSYPRSGGLSTEPDAEPVGAIGDYACVSGNGSTDWTGPKANGPMIAAKVIKKQDGRIIEWRERTSFDDIERGTSCTLLLGEKHVPPKSMGQAKQGDGCVYNGQYPASSARIVGPGFGLAATPDAPFHNGFGSYHHDLCNFLRADLSLMPVATNVNESVLGEMATREK